VALEGDISGCWERANMKEHASKVLEKKILSYLLEYPDQQHEYMPQLSVDDFYHNREVFKLY